MMANEKRLIDANELSETLSSLTMIITGLRTGKGFLQKYLTEYRKTVLALVDEAPTVDAVEVVRCKDCKKWLRLEPSGTNCRVCADSTRIRLPYDFCSYGERKDNEY